MARKTTTPPTSSPDPNGVPWDDGPAPAASTGTDLDIFGGDAGAVVAFDPAELQRGINNLIGSIAATRGIGGGMVFMGVNQNDGSWHYGAEHTETEPNAEWVLNTRTLKHGWSAWKEGKSLDSRLVSIFEPRPDVTSLKPEALPWAKEAYSVVMRCLSGEDKGVTGLFETSSGGGAECFGKLTEALRPRFMAASQFLFPVVLLRETNYHNSKYGKRIYKPHFHIVRFVDARGNSEGQQAPVPPAPKPASPAAAAAVNPSAAPQPGVRRRRPVDA